MHLIHLIDHKTGWNRPLALTDLGIHLDGLLGIFLGLLDFVQNGGHRSHSTTYCRLNI